MRIGPARDIAGGVDPGNAGFEIGVDGDAAIERKAGLLGQRQPRPHADADHDQIGLQHAAAFERRALAVDRGDGIAEMEDHAVLLMQRADEVAHRGAEHALHRPLLQSHHMDLDLARPQRGRGFQPDKTRADHDGAARAFGSVDDGAAIGERAQHMNMRLVGARESAAAPARRRSPAAGGHRERLAPPASTTLRALVSIEATSVLSRRSIAASA